MLTYASSVWEYGTPGHDNQSILGLYLPIKADPALGVGWTFTLGAIKPCGIVQNSVCYVSPDGAEHLFDFSQTIPAFRDKFSFAATAVGFAIVSSNRCAGTEDLFPDYLRFGCLR